jgi:hypothetical protein
MANSGGGTIEFDLGPETPSISIHTVSDLLESANRFLSSKPEALFHGIKARDNRNVIVLQIMGSRTPVTADGVVLVRAGGVNRAAGAGELQRFVRDGSSEEDLHDYLAAFAGIIESQGQKIEAQSQKMEELIKSGSWTNKLMWAMLGAVIGAVVGIIPTMWLA